MFFMLLVLINTIVLACQYAGMPDEEQSALNTVNAILTHIFAVEVGLKIIAFGPKPFFLEAMNLFDFFVVVMSYVEAALAGGSSSLTALRSLRILRVFRIIRIFKIFEHLKGINKLTKVIVSSLSNFSYVSALLLLIMAVYSVLGMHLFGYKTYDGVRPPVSYTHLTLPTN